MKILSLYKSNYDYSRNNTNSIVFSAKGKPLSLQYIVDKRAELLPKRILQEAKKYLKLPLDKQPTLLEIHRKEFAPLLTCETLTQAKKLYPEFEEVLDKVKFKRKSIYAKVFQERTDEKFALKMLQEYWGKLKTKEEIAEDLGMPCRTSLDWALEQINFVGFPKNYNKILKASDPIENKIIADKTTAWNALHPDLMYKHNKEAAQGCKTEKYRKEQSIRIKEYDKAHPERIEKITLAIKEGWDNCPEVKAAMAEFASKEALYTRSALMKKFTKQKLSPQETRTIKGFFKRFWDSHPELKKIYGDARRKNKLVN